MRANRLNQMEEYILQKGTATLYDLQNQFGISIFTVRRDVGVLMERGRIRKVYGGVASVDSMDAAPSIQLLPLTQRAAMHAAEKQVIGELAARLVEEDSVIFLDSGSTVPLMLPHLADRNVTIITHSLNVMYEAAKYPSLRVLGLGGLLNRYTFSYVGSTCALRDIHPQALFMAASALSAKTGAGNNSYEEYTMKSEIVSMYSNIIVLADHSKLDRDATFTYCPFSRIRGIVTDSTPSPGFMEAARESGISVYCPESGES